MSKYMEKSNIFGVIALIVAVAALGLLFGMKYQSQPSISCVNGGSQGSVPSKFGSSDMLTTGDITATSLVAPTVSSTAAILTFKGTGGTIATTTYDGTTSTVSLQGRSCFNLVSPTGTHVAVTFSVNGVQTVAGTCER